MHRQLPEHFRVLHNHDLSVDGGFHIHRLHNRVFNSALRLKKQRNVSGAPLFLLVTCCRPYSLDDDCDEGFVAVVVASVVVVTWSSAT